MHDESPSKECIMNTSAGTKELNKLINVYL